MCVPTDAYIDICTYAYVYVGHLCGQVRFLTNLVRLARSTNGEASLRVEGVSFACCFLLLRLPSQAAVLAKACAQVPNLVGTSQLLSRVCRTLQLIPLLHLISEITRTATPLPTARILSETPALVPPPKGTPGLPPPRRRLQTMFFSLETKRRMLAASQPMFLAGE